ncbi:hypothetical protein L7F22_022394 [Adiantum nelumboides]|nr:hypothetical protein [Adiantum nelumboides]
MEQSNGVLVVFNRSKVMQLLGAANPSERIQIDEHLNATFCLSSSVAYCCTCRNMRAKHSKDLSISPRKLKLFPLPSLRIMARAWESTNWLTKSPCLCASQDLGQIEDADDDEQHFVTFSSTMQNHGKHALSNSTECTPTALNYKAHPLPLPPSLPKSPSVSPSPSSTTAVALRYKLLCKPGVQRVIPFESLPFTSTTVHSKLLDVVPSAEISTNLCSSLSMPLSFSNLSRPLPPANAWCPQNWTMGVVLGQGSFGIVREGLNLEDGSFFAVKISNTEDTSLEIQQEIDVLSKLEHPNIVRYLGSSIKDGPLCIFLELMQMGSLATLLKKYKRLEDITVRSYTRQILLGLAYLHENKTMHRDIKCANILVDVNGRVKLSDFGGAKQMGESLFSSVKGTPLYMAPEVLTPNGKCYSFSADIWSLGCTILEMADGKPPWSDLEGFGFLFKVKNGELPPMPDHLSPEGKDFVCCCLKLVASDRPTAVELLQHPFVKNLSSPRQFVSSSPMVPTIEATLFPSLRVWQPLESYSCTMGNTVGNP